MYSLARSLLGQCPALKQAGGWEPASATRQLEGDSARPVACWQTLAGHTAGRKRALRKRTVPPRPRQCQGRRSAFQSPGAAIACHTPRLNVEHANARYSEFMLVVGAARVTAKSSRCTNAWPPPITP
jgi:hypothetical protein